MKEAANATYRDIHSEEILQDVDAQLAQIALDTAKIKPAALRPLARDLVGEVRQRWVAGTLDELDAEAELQMLAAIVMMKSGSAARHPLANQTIGATVGQIARALSSISTCPSDAHSLCLTPAQTLRAEITRQRTPALERD